MAESDSGRAGRRRRALEAAVKWSVFAALTLGMFAGVGAALPASRVVRADVAAEAVALLAALAWVVMLRTGSFKPPAYRVLAVSIVLLYAGFLQKLLNELYEVSPAASVVANVAVGLGLVLATAGLLIRNRDHARAVAAIEDGRAEFLRLSVTDSLTGLYNSKRFFDVIDAELNRARRYGRRLSLAFLDIDDFKSFNDTHGHLEGDRLLREVARVIRSECRENDLAFRYGGEEFTIILPETDVEHAVVVADRIRSRVAETLLRLRDGATDGRTVSVGVSAFTEDVSSIKDLIDRADKAMYRAKLAGKNQVRAA